MEIHKINLIIFAIFLLGVITIWVIVFTTDHSLKEVDCFDRYGNKIIGEKCIQESSFEKDLMMASIVTILVIFILTILLVTRRMINSI